MPFVAIIILVGSAFLHASWNLLLKKAEDKFITIWWGILIGSLVFLPFLFFTGLPGRNVWGFLGVSVLLEVTYYALLALAYRLADFSLVYPMARGAAPALTASWTFLFLRETVSPWGLVGLGLIVLGLLTAGSSSWWQARQDRVQWQGIALAATLAVIVSVYTTVDGTAVKQTIPFAYTVMVFFLSPLVISPLMFRHYGWQALKSGLQRQKLRIVIIGLLNVIAYLLVVWAYSFAPLSYASAVREVSVVLGALAGWLFLGEKFGGWRLAAALIIFCGILTISILG